MNSGNQNIHDLRTLKRLNIDFKSNQRNAIYLGRHIGLGKTSEKLRVLLPIPKLPNTNFEPNEVVAYLLHLFL